MIVFVHGVPETAAVWDGVRGSIDRESVALSLPGFGCARPDGFTATKDAYVDWLVAELAAVDGPVDLVGHDWGAPLAFRVAATHPDRLRSWVVDVGGLMHPEYEWHALAKIWQTPGEGEAFFAAQTALSVEDRAAGVEILGVPHDAALAIAAAIDPTMGGCIVDLYRSAMPNCHADWGPWSTIDVPGALLVATDDPFGDPVKATEVAGAVGATVIELEGAGHFWPASSPQQAAQALEGFWATVP
jgi:pimeloyl-ACP methyl ester carboxylesterase